MAASKETPRFQHRDVSSVYRFWKDGCVDVLVWRRVERAMGGWEEVVCTGRSVDDAERAYYEESCRRAEASVAQARRRQRWGPLGVSRPK